MSTVVNLWMGELTKLTDKIRLTKSHKQQHSFSIRSKTTQNESDKERGGIRNYSACFGVVEDFGDGGFVAGRDGVLADGSFCTLLAMVTFLPLVLMYNCI
ncbi:hypothetical protein LXL04_017455 [Taraxacum kok-saghyz]